MIKFATIAALSTFLVLGIVCAIVLALPPRGVGRRSHRPADPYRYSFGDMPGFSREQLEYYARRPVEEHQHHHSSGGVALQSAAGSGMRVSSRPLPLPANFNGRRLFSPPDPKPPFGRGRRAF